MLHATLQGCFWLKACPGIWHITCLTPIRHQHL